MDCANEARGRCCSVGEHAWSLWPKGIGKPKRVWLVINPITSQTRHKANNREPRHENKMSAIVQDDASALADRLLAASDAIDLTVSWIGNESLQAMDVIARITEQVKRSSLDFGAGMRATISTDGRQLNRDTAELLRRNRVKRAIVTIDDANSWKSIEENFADPMPFPIDVRIGGLNGCERVSLDLRERIGRYAAQSSNTITVSENDSVLVRSAQDSLLICIDAEGKLYTSPEEMKEPEKAFGDASTWSPADPAEREVVAKCLHKGERVFNTEAELKNIGETARPVFEAWGVIRAWVFGTFALGEPTDFSDIDMLVQRRRGSHLGYRFLDLKRDLEECLGRKVGLKLPPPDPDNMDSFYKYVFRNRVLVYEAGEASSGISG